MRSSRAAGEPDGANSSVQMSSAESSAEASSGSAAPAPEGAYRVLARKYRPANFGDLIGQDAMVRTISSIRRSCWA